MTSFTAPVQHRRRLGLLLAGAQARYQLLLLFRNRMSTFTILVVPLMLLVVLDLVGPEKTLRGLTGVRYVVFLTPAMAVFGLLNSCYVSVLTSVVAARESGVLKRLRGTPLPLSAYIAGRLVAAGAMGVLSVGVILATGALFLHVQVSGALAVAMLTITAASIVCFGLLGLAVSSLVSNAESALAVAYGSLLPVAFISDVFFPATSSPSWLRHVAALLPVAPIARAAEAACEPGWSGSVLRPGQLAVVGCWTAGALLVVTLAFRWQPGESLIGRLRGR